MGKKDLTGGKLSVGLWEKRAILRTASSSLLLLPRLNFIPLSHVPLSHLHQPSVAQGGGKWGLLLVHSSSSLLLLPHTFTLPQCGAPAMGSSLSWGYQVWVLLVTVVLQDLLHMVFSSEYRPSGTDCFSMGPPRNAAPVRKLLHRISPGCSFLHGLPTCSSTGISMGCRWMYPTGSSMTCTETALCRHGHLQGVLCSAPREHFPLPFSPCLVSARLVLPVFSKSSPTAVALWFFWNASLNKLS